MVERENDRAIFWVYLESTIRRDAENNIVHRVVLSNMTKRKQAEEILEKALHDEIKTLSRIIPICASCKKVRDDQGYWNAVEAYIQKHSGAQFSHLFGVCQKIVPGLIIKHFLESKLRLRFLHVINPYVN